MPKIRFCMRKTIIECETIEEANNVNFEDYRLSENISAKKGVYAN